MTTDGTTTDGTATDGTTDDRPAGRARRSPQPSTVALAVGLVLGTVLLLWGADWAARLGAQSAVAGSIRTATGVSEEPVVKVRGTFFLPQVVRGVYDDVDIAVDGLTSGPLRVAHLRARLSGVHLSFHDVLVQSFAPLYVERATERASLRYDDLDAYLQATGRPFRIAAAPDGLARLTGTVTVLGQDVSASTLAQLGTRDGDLTVRPTQLDTDTALDRASELLLQQRLTFLVPLDPLPFGQQLTAVDVRRSGLVVDARGTGILVRP